MHNVLYPPLERSRVPTNCPAKCPRKPSGPLKPGKACLRRRLQHIGNKRARSRAQKIPVYFDKIDFGPQNQPREALIGGQNIRARAEHEKVGFAFLGGINRPQNLLWAFRFEKKSCWSPDPIIRNTG